MTPGLDAVVVERGGRCAGRVSLRIRHGGDLRRDRRAAAPLRSRQQSARIHRRQALIGTIFGSIGAGKPAERYGRRPVLHALAVLYLVTAAGCGLAWNWSALVVFRFIGGLAIGASSVVAPMHRGNLAGADARAAGGAQSIQRRCRNPGGVFLELPDRGADRRLKPRRGAGCWALPRCRRRSSSCWSCAFPRARGGWRRSTGATKPSGS